MGDYLDVQTVPFVRSGGNWVANLFSETPTPFQAAWTDNRDALVGPGDPALLAYQPPLPPGSVAPGNCSTVPATTRNANVYTARITPGVFVSAPGNAKQSIGSDGVAARAFPVGISNSTDVLRRFRVSLPGQPPGGSASFNAFTLTTQVFVDIPRRSSASRTVHVRSTAVFPPVPVTVVDVTGVSDSAPGRPVGSLLLNADPQNPEIENPEIENPEIENPEIENAEVHNPEIENPEIENPEIENPEIENPEIENPEIENRNVQNPEIENPEIENPEIENPEIENPEIENPEIENGSITDVTVDVTNNGNTTSSFQVNFAVGGDTSAWLFQLVAWRAYSSPTATNCVLSASAQAQVLVNITDPDISGIFRDPNDDDLRNATVLLAPGETIKLTLRAIDKDASPTPIPGQDGDSSTPFVPFCAPNTTCDVTNPIAVLTRAQAPNTGEVQPPVDVESPGQGATNWPIRFDVQPSDTSVGNPIAPPIAVEVRDTTGAALPGVAVTMSLTPNHPGATLTGTLTRLTDATGIAYFNDLVVGPAGSNYSLIATITVPGPLQFAATSDPFDVLAAPVPVFLVTTTANAGPGSLRQAISDANALPGANNIQFNIPGGGVQTVVVTAPLPPITDQVVIDGWTQPGWSGAPLVGLQWSGAFGNEVGLQFDPGSSFSTLRGFRITRFGDESAGTSGIGAWLRADSITLHGNYFGVDGLGVQTPNHTGVQVDANAAAIGGTLPVHRNVISSGFTGVAVTAGDLTTIAGNYIGLNPLGDTAFGNAAHGVSVTGSATNLSIGSTAAGSGNVISGNLQNAIQVLNTPVNTIIARNIIGLAAPGSGAVPDDMANLGYGIFVTASQTRIGEPGAGNHVAESGLDGIRVTDPAANVLIRGNVVGWSPGGGPRGNSGHGISILSVPNVVIGGTLGASTRNVVANNSRNISVEGFSSGGTIIQGNYAGIDVSGTLTGPQTFGESIYVDAPNTQILENVVAGAGEATAPGTNIPGVLVTGLGNGSALRGNRVGTNAAGTAALGNQGPGVRIDAPNVVVGGPTPADGNLLSGNRPFGLDVTANGHDAVIESNMIGTDAAGSIDLGNGGVAFAAGIHIAGNDVRVGGAGHTAVNIIRFNHGAGIDVTGGTGSHFPGILSYDNQDMGIDLGADDVINNDALDADSGPNNLQNTVAGIGGGYSGGMLTMAVTFRGEPNQNVQIRFYRNTACAPGSEAEAEEFLTQPPAGVTLDGLGQGQSWVSVPYPVGGGQVSAALVDGLGNNSELIDCAQVETATGFATFSQPVNGSAQSINVVVTDTSGAAVPGALVTVTFTNESMSNTFNGGQPSVSTIANASGQALLNFTIDNADPTVSLEFNASLPGFSFPRGVSVTFSVP